MDDIACQMPIQSSGSSCTLMRIIFFGARAPHTQLENPKSGTYFISTALHWWKKVPQNASYLVGGIHFIVINHALIFKKLTLNHLLKGTEKPHSKELCQNQSSNMSCITEAISKVEQTRDMKNVEKASFKVTHFLFALASLRSQNFLLDRFFLFLCC